MRASGGGAIVNVGSIAGHRVIRGNCLYNASKSALSMLTKTAALECGAIRRPDQRTCTRPVMTPMLHAFIEKSQKTATPFSEQA